MVILLISHPLIWSLRDHGGQSSLENLGSLERPNWYNEVHWATGGRHSSELKNRLNIHDHLFCETWNTLVHMHCTKQSIRLRETCAEIQNDTFTCVIAIKGCKRLVSSYLQEYETTTRLKKAHHIMQHSALLLRPCHGIAWKWSNILKLHVKQEASRQRSFHAHVYSLLFDLHQSSSASREGRFPRISLFNAWARWPRSPVQYFSITNTKLHSMNSNLSTTTSYIEASHTESREISTSTLKPASILGGSDSRRRLDRVFFRGYTARYLLIRFIIGFTVGGIVAAVVVIIRHYTS